MDRLLKYFLLGFGCAFVMCFILSIVCQQKPETVIVEKWRVRTDTVFVEKEVEAEGNGTIVNSEKRKVKSTHPPSPSQEGEKLPAAFTSRWDSTDGKGLKWTVDYFYPENLFKGRFKYRKERVIDSIFVERYVAEQHPLSPTLSPEGRKGENDVEAGVGVKLWGADGQIKYVPYFLVAKNFDWWILRSTIEGRLLINVDKYTPPTPSYRGGIIEPELGLSIKVKF